MKYAYDSGEFVFKEALFIGASNLMIWMVAARDIQPVLLPLITTSLPLTTHNQHMNMKENHDLLIHHEDTKACIDQILVFELVP